MLLIIGQNGDHQSISNNMWVPRSSVESTIAGYTNYFRLQVVLFSLNISKVEGSLVVSPNIDAALIAPII